MSSVRYQIVAHRGLPFQFPENSLLGFDAAIRAGAVWCETDVQLTSDGVPILFHDDDTRRLCGCDGPITSWKLADLQRFGLFQPDRFGARFRGNPVTTLRQLLTRLAGHPAVRLFVELKGGSEVAFGTAHLVDTVLATIAACNMLDRVVVISFSGTLIQAVRAKSAIPIGWVTNAWGEGTPAHVASLDPDFLFLDRRLVTVEGGPKVTHGPDRWQTVLYTVNDEPMARQLMQGGYTWIETDHFDKLGALAR